jgi:hypothetical protein
MAVYRYTEADKARIKSNPLNRGSCGYLPKLVFDLEKTLERAQNVRAVSQKDKEVKQKAVANAWQDYEQKLEILNTYKECFPEEFNKNPIKKPD